MLHTPTIISTPNNYGRLVIAPACKKGAFDSPAVDCPFPFYHDGKFRMTYVGWDGTGYQTGLASSDDLLNWQKDGLLPGRGPQGSVTEHNAALTCILRENELFGPGTLKRANGRFGGTCHAYPRPGYETGPAVIGLCCSDDLKHWRKAEKVLIDVGADGSIDRRHAHKPGIISQGHRLYPFYCAIAPAKDRRLGEIEHSEVRGIALATN